ncbi:MAG TPA: polysaccharide deacetylase family protein [Fimbriimonadaceae bacterium]|nr:polysaccharide deacetylase family protein [Fimbriimonadaceae bacterium]
MSRTPILCYHKVGPVQEEGRRLNVEPDRLEAHARYFRRRGYSFGLPRDLGTGWPVRSVYFTFDDAYTSALTYGREALERVGAFGAFYAVPERVGGVSSWDVGFERPLASWDQLLDAAAAGHEIGDHTLTHADLSTMEELQQLEEIQGGRQHLLTRGLNPHSFCYPWGRYSSVTESVLAGVGYRVALALGKRMASATDSLLALPRIVVAYGDAVPMLLYKMHVRPLLP